MYDEIIAHTQEGGADEICGMIAGRDGRAVRLYRVENAAENKPVRYVMQPEDQLRVLKDIDENGWDVLAIYHSHPSSINYPSATDVADAEQWPDPYYIICTLTNPEKPLRAFRLANGEINEAEVMIADK